MWTMLEEKTKVSGSCPFDVVVEANDSSFLAGGRDRGKRGAQKEDERRGGNGRQLDRRPAGYGQSVPRAWGPA